MAKKNITQAQMSDQDIKRMSDLVDRLNQARKDSAEADSIKERMMEFMRGLGLKSYKANDLTLRLVDERRTNTFNIGLLRQKYPDIYAECFGEKVIPARLFVEKQPTNGAPVSVQQAVAQALPMDSLTDDELSMI